MATKQADRFLFHLYLHYVVFSDTLLLSARRAQRKSPDRD
jgi:hypothetical protein